MVSSVNRRVASANALSYMGVNPATPPNLVTYTFAPATDDTNAPLGTLWLVIDPTNPSPPTPQIWLLGNVVGFTATWVELYPGSGSGVNQIVTNMGTAIESMGAINIFGVNVITTTGSGNTVTIEMTDGTDGQLLIGGGTEPQWANLTSTGGTVTISTGANTLNIEATVSGNIHDIVTDSGTATESNNIINILGGTLINTSASGNTITIAMDNGLNGQVPIAATSAATAYANLMSHDGSVFITNGPNSIDLSVQASTKSGFFYYQATDYVVTYGTQTTFYLGASKILTKLFDVNNDVYPGNGTYNFTNYPPPSPMPNSFPGRAYFTAPVTGTYMFGTGILTNNGNLLAAPAIGIGTSEIATQFYALFIFQPPTGPQLTISNRAETLISLTKGQQVWVGTRVVTRGGASTVYGGSGSPNYVTYFWGFLVYQS
jgi:hypothetical protein